jgi:hypothetical protein
LLWIPFVFAKHPTKTVYIYIYIFIRIINHSFFISFIVLFYLIKCIIHVVVVTKWKLNSKSNVIFWISSLVVTTFCRTSTIKINRFNRMKFLLCTKVKILKSQSQNTLNDLLLFWCFWNIMLHVHSLNFVQNKITHLRTMTWYIMFLII